MSFRRYPVLVPRSARGGALGEIAAPVRAKDGAKSSRYCNECRAGCERSDEGANQRHPGEERCDYPKREISAGADDERSKHCTTRRVVALLATTDCSASEERNCNESKHCDARDHHHVSNESEWNQKNADDRDSEEN